MDVVLHQQIKPIIIRNHKTFLDKKFDCQVFLDSAEMLFDNGTKVYIIMVSIWMVMLISFVQTW